MNVFSNNLLVAMSILYFILSDVKCSCFSPKTTLSKLFPTKESECVQNLQSSSAADRLICPSWSKINIDHNRTPKTLIEKKCCHNECLAGEGYKCEEYIYPIEVIYDYGKDTQKAEILPMPIACVCTAPRCLPEPPRK